MSAGTGRALHPLNRGFQWSDTRPPYRCVTPEQARDYDERGFFVLEDAFDAETVARVVAEIDPVEEQVEAFLGGLGGGA